MLSKIYAVQPYEVGPKNRKKSLVLVIPTKIAEVCNINTSTIFAIQLDDQKKNITFQIVNVLNEREIMPVAESFKASSKQASNEIH
jgi:hypothetical protein